MLKVAVYDAKQYDRDFLSQAIGSEKISWDFYGRGKVIDNHALIEALKKGHIGGVALDTYEEEEGVFFEDLSDKILLDDELARLLTFQNVLITAHQAFLAKEALQEIAHTTVDNLIKLEQKSPFLPGTEL